MAFWQKAVDGRFFGSAAPRRTSLSGLANGHRTQPVGTIDRGVC